MNDMDSPEHARGESVGGAGPLLARPGAPLALIGGAFMTLMGYPPLAGIMDTATLSGL